MSNPKCGICKSKMVKNGTTSAGRQRWRCLSCGSSSVKRNDTRSRWLKVFVGWLLGKASQSELGMAARTFRDKTTAFWDLWPIIPICDEIHHVVYMDGIWLTRKCIILIACTEDHVIGCHLAQSENSKDWACLMARIAAPASSSATEAAASRRPGAPHGRTLVSKDAPSMPSARSKDAPLPGQRRRLESTSMPLRRPYAHREQPGSGRVDGALPQMVF